MTSARWPYSSIWSKRAFPLGHKVSIFSMLLDTHVDIIKPVKNHKVIPKGVILYISKHCFWTPRNAL